MLQLVSRVFSGIPLKPLEPESSAGFREGLRITAVSLRLPVSEYAALPFLVIFSNGREVMALPGFNAETSLYKTSLHYRLMGASVHADGVRFQQFLVPRRLPVFIPLPRNLGVCDPNGWYSCDDAWNTCQIYGGEAGGDPSKCCAWWDAHCAPMNSGIPVGNGDGSPPPGGVPHM